ncbi:MAG TPA: ion channel [Rhodanobacteraceae bacterium]|nr:ion channel [Rhodanobacteraceae bacterium]
MALAADVEPPRLQWLRTLRRHPSAILLLVQLLQVVAYPLLEQTHLARPLLGGFGVLVLLLALRMIRQTVRHVAAGLVLASIAIVLNVLWIGFGLVALQPWQAAMQAVFYFFAAGCLISYMYADQRVSRDEFFAAGATFTLLVWAFTYVLLLCQWLDPAAFSAAVAGQPRSWSEMLFLSFALFSSTGIGDVIPLSPIARGVADLEMFSGVMYLALVVSRLIGLSVSQRQR